MNEKKENTEINEAPEAPKQKTLHIIHHNDLDGICAAAIVAARTTQYLAEKNLLEENRHLQLPIIFSETNYNRPADLSQMKPGDAVTIVDFSFPPEEMAKIEAAINYNPDAGIGEIVWIDHHKTAENYNYSYDGLRDFSNKGPAGCELTWKFFFPGELRPMPKAVSLIGDYDAWRLQIPESREFYEGAKMFCLSPESVFWARLFVDNDDTLKLIQAGGAIALAYRDQYCQSIRKSYGYETFLGEHKAYAMNLMGFGSGQFGQLFHEYPLVIAYVHDGIKFTVSLYSETIDVGEIAKSLGGGGHKGAAGFVCFQLPFNPALPK